MAGEENGGPASLAGIMPPWFQGWSTTWPGAERRSSLCHFAERRQGVQPLILGFGFHATRNHCNDAIFAVVSRPAGRPITVSCTIGCTPKLKKPQRSGSGSVIFVGNGAVLQMQERQCRQAAVMSRVVWSQRTTPADEMSQVGRPRDRKTNPTERFSLHSISGGPTGGMRRDGKTTRIRHDASESSLRSTQVGPSSRSITAWTCEDRTVVVPPQTTSVNLDDLCFSEYLL